VRRLINYGAACALALTLLTAAHGPNVALAQDSAAAATADVKREGMNHDVQLHLLAASHEPVSGGNVPPSMEAVVRQLRAALPFSNYRVATTFLNRVRDGGSVEVSGVGGAPLTAATANSTSPTFFNFGLSNVRLLAGANDQPFIQVSKLRFGLKVPIQTATVAGDGGKGSYPVIQYQDTGITTEVSVREGTPTVVGTLAASRPDESFILVLTLRRTSTR
jgi:hypothetical protein